MRTNRFGESYCHTAAEALSRIDPAGGVSACYVPDTFTTECQGGNRPATSVEVAENMRGDSVCYIEGASESAVRAIITELGLEIV